MLIGTFTHDPDERLDYPIDWSEWLDTGDQIGSSVWLVPPDLTVVTDTILNGGLVTAVWITGGTPGKDHYLVNAVTTILGRVKEATILLKIRQDR